LHIAEASSPILVAVGVIGWCAWDCAAAIGCHPSTSSQKKDGPQAAEDDVNQARQSPGTPQQRAAELSATNTGLGGLPGAAPPIRSLQVVCYTIHT
jgi:hypothetical protein